MSESRDPNQNTTTGSASGSESAPAPMPAQEETGFGAALSRYSKKASELSASLLSRAKSESAIAKLRGDQLMILRQRKQHLHRIGELLVEQRKQPEVEALRASLPALARELDAVAQLETRAGAQAAEIEALRARDGQAHS